MRKQADLLIFIAVFHISSGLYIKHALENVDQNMAKVGKNIINDKWGIYQRKLGLTDQKVELLKSQKNQRATINLLNRYINENPKYASEAAKAVNSDKLSFHTIYRFLMKQKKLSRKTFKTSLNFELADEPLKNLKRVRRKIAFKLVSDLPSDKIDDLLQMFNQQHGINNLDLDLDDRKEDADYIDFPDYVPFEKNPEYIYDNLYEDEEDLEVPTKSHHNSEYGSFQELILQTKRNQWQQEIDETKLRNYNNEHFV